MVRCSNPKFLVAQQLKEIHVTTAQRYAAAAYNDGLTEGTIRDLASLATWGRNPQNCERDLHRWMPYAYDSGLKTHSTAIEVYNPDTAKIEMMEIPVLLASDVLNALWRKQDPKLWDECIGATSENCREYWEYAEMDWATDHPVIQFFGCTLLAFCFPSQSFFGQTYPCFQPAPCCASGKGFTNALSRSLGKHAWI